MEAMDGVCMLLVESQLLPQLTQGSPEAAPAPRPLTRSTAEQRALPCCLARGTLPAEVTSVGEEHARGHSSTVLWITGKWKKL